MKPPKAVIKSDAVPFAESDVNDAVWPVVNKHPQRLEVNYEDVDGKFEGQRPARRFTASRADGKRWHVGVDLYGTHGDLVRACEDGIVVNFYYFYENTWALLVEHEDFVINYGEVDGNSLSEFKLKIGSPVKQGQSIARIGRLNSGNSMVHFETYLRGTTTNQRWMVGEKRPSRLLNPTRYLLALAAKEAGDPAPALPALQPALSPVVLRSPALSGDPVLQEIASGTSALEMETNVRQPGVAAIQRALNLLAGKNPSYKIDLGVGEMNAGIFGSRTDMAVRALQKKAKVGVNGKVNRDTLEALDEALYQEFGGLVPAPAPAPVFAPVPPKPALIHSYRLPDPAPGATINGTKESSTPPWKGAYHGDASETSGSKVAETTYSDGTIVTQFTEALEARVDGKKYGPREAGQVRVKQGDVTVVEQRNYAWLGREMPLVVLIENHPGFEKNDYETAPATFFGKKDQTDSGCGTPSYKTVQTNSDVLGASVKQKRMEKLLGGKWIKISGTPALLGATLEIYHPKTKRFARVPLVDVGPRGDLEAEVDLSHSLNAFLGGTGKTKMQFRVVLS